MLDWIKTKTNKNRKDFGKFNFHLKSEPQFIDSSTTLTLTAYSNVFQNATIPCVYRWSVIRNGFKIQRHQFRGSSFRCDPADVGAVIQAQVISTDSEYNGTAIIHFGPVKLDMNLKKHIETALNAGGSVITAHLVQGCQERQCQMSLAEDIVRIDHVYSQANFTFDHSISYPIIQCISKDQNQNHIVIRFGPKHHQSLKAFKQKIFNSSINDLSTSSRSTNLHKHNNENSDNFLQIKFANHSARDIFIFVWKGLTTKRQLTSSLRIDKIQNIDFSKGETIDYVMEIEGLKSYVHKMDEALKKANQQKTIQAQEIHKLKMQMQSTIYKRALEQKNNNSLNLSHDFTFLTQKTQQTPSNKYKHLQNNHLNSRINALTNEIDAIRFQPKIMNSARLSTEPMKQSMKSPFSKKITQDDSQNFISLLDDLSTSRVSEISEIGYVMEDQQLKMRLQKVEKEKQQLQKKLDMSFHKIQKLQNELYMNRSNCHLQTHNMSQNCIASNNHSFLNKSINFTAMSSPKNQSFLSVKTWKKEPVFMEQDKELLALLMKKDKEITMLRQQTQTLHKEKTQLSNELHNLKSTILPKLQCKFTSLQEQVQIKNRNSDAMNRSQQLSSQMTEFNEQQLKMLKKHNEFLTNENAKLSKACEKYMNEARECTKLRMQTMKLREKINSDKMF